MEKPDDQNLNNNGAGNGDGGAGDGGAGDQGKGDDNNQDDLEQFDPFDADSMNFGDDDNDDDADDDDDNGNGNGKGDDDKNKNKTPDLSNQIHSLKREQELTNFMLEDGNEIYKPFVNKIRELSKDPRTRGLNISAIATLAAGKNLLKIGAKLASKAQAETNANNMGGGNGQRKTGNEGDLPDPTNMDSATFNAALDKILSGAKR